LDYEFAAVPPDSVGRSSNDVISAIVWSAGLAVDDDPPWERGGVGVLPTELAVDGEADVRVDLLLQRPDLRVGAAPWSVDNDVQLNSACVWRHSDKVDLRRVEEVRLAVVRLLVHPKARHCL